MRAPVAIHPHHLAALVNIAECFTSDNPAERRFHDAIAEVRAELEAGGMTVEELLAEIDAEERA